jgi:hypothetical protein
MEQVMALNTEDFLNIDGEIYLRDSDLASELEVRTATLRTWDKNGTGPLRLKLGRRVVYPLTELHNRVKNKMVDEGLKKTKIMIPGGERSGMETK